MTEAAELVVGVVGRPWGIRGQFVLDPRGSDPQVFLSRATLRLRRRDGERVELPILGSHLAGGRLVLRVEGCATPEEAERFRGAEVLLEPEALAPAPEGTYYPHELTGLRAIRRGGGELGRVERVVETAGPDLLEVRSEGRLLLIPFAAAICRVDREGGVIEIDPPEGLLELE